MQTIQEQSSPLIYFIWVLRPLLPSDLVHLIFSIWTSPLFKAPSLYPICFSLKDKYELLAVHQNLPIAVVRGICIGDKGNIHVSLYFENRIAVFSLQGESLQGFGKQGISPGEFSGPYGLAVDAEFNIYVCDKNSQRVQVFKRDHSFYFQFPVEGCPCGIAISSNSNILVSVQTERNQGDPCISVYSSDGSLLYSFGSYGSGPGHFIPMGICEDNRGRILVSEVFNPRISIFSPDGKFLGKIDGSEKNGTKRETGTCFIVVDQKSRIVVSDKERVIVLDQEGGLVTEFQAFGSVYGIAVDGAGNIITTVYGTDSKKTMKIFG